MSVLLERTVAMLSRFRLFSIISSLFLVATVVSADPPTTPVTIGLSELKFLNGSWEGYLEYLDYGDGKTKVRLPTIIRYEPKQESMQCLDLLHRAKWFQG